MIKQGDCIDLIKDVPNDSVDLVIIDPPYLIECTQAGGHGNLAKRIQKYNDELEEESLVSGFDETILEELLRVMKNINLYVWCNHKQIPMYLDFFVKQNNCSFDVLIWNKVNAPPMYSNKYLTDKEYCLYFRKGGYCNPQNYENAKTVWYQPINKLDKDTWGHPTIKPLNIIETLIDNSSKEGDIILDCFMGSGTTGVACERLHRNFIGFEINKKYFEIAKERIEAEQNQMRLF